ncbi:TPA_asm: protein 2 [Allium angulosum virus 1]|uniref:protein 2 n=1 Tax=Allium angulosum virus 1 TaxID=2851934 RepID=UPI002055020C|nr:protein 2 [Allium angulosum virus 1]DAZ85333.1 TPA_asm: protein 2 [Allium angulosum virus 1]
MAGSKKNKNLKDNTAAGKTSFFQKNPDRKNDILMDSFVINNKILMEKEMSMLQIKPELGKIKNYTRFANQISETVDYTEIFQETKKDPKPAASMTTRQAVKKTAGENVNYENIENTSPIRSHLGGTQDEDDLGSHSDDKKVVAAGHEEGGEEQKIQKENKKMLEKRESSNSNESKSISAGEDFDREKTDQKKKRKLEDVKGKNIGGEAQSEENFSSSQGGIKVDQFAMQKTEMMKFMKKYKIDMTSKDFERMMESAAKAGMVTEQFLLGYKRGMEQSHEDIVERVQKISEHTQGLLSDTCTILAKISSKVDESQTYEKSKKVKVTHPSGPLNVPPKSGVVIQDQKKTVSESSSKKKELTKRVMDYYKNHEFNREEKSKMERYLTKKLLWIGLSIDTLTTGLGISLQELYGCLSHSPDEESAFLSKLGGKSIAPVKLFELLTKYKQKGTLPTLGA